MRVVSMLLAGGVLGFAASAGAGVASSPTTLKLSNPQTGMAVQNSVAFTNAGTTAVNLTGASITMGAGPFVITSPPSYPVSLQPNASIMINVTFTATMTGRTPGQLTLTTDAVDTPMVTVALLGGAGAPVLAVSPLSAVFSPTHVGTASAPQTITITNSGNSQLTLFAPTFDSNDGGAAQDFTLDLTGIVTTLDIDDTATFKVAFTPLTIGSKTVNVDVTSTDMSLEVVVLGGTALAPLADLGMVVPVLGSDMSMSSFVPDMAARGGPNNSTAPPKMGCGCYLGGSDPAPAGPLTLVALALAAGLIVRGPAARQGRGRSR
jgi:hypothetical protein